MVVLVTIMMKSTNESIVGGRMIVQQLVQGFHLPLQGLSLIPYYNFYVFKNVRAKLRPKINISMI